MKSLPTIDHYYKNGTTEEQVVVSPVSPQEQSPYVIERANNDAKISQMLAMLFPDTDVPFDVIFDIIKLMTTTKVNPRAIPQVIDGVHQLQIREKEGQVIVVVRKEYVSVQLRENYETLKAQIDEENDLVEKTKAGDIDAIVERMRKNREK